MCYFVFIIQTQIAKFCWAVSKFPHVIFILIAIVNSVPAMLYFVQCAGFEENNHDTYQIFLTEMSVGHMSQFDFAGIWGGRKSTL